MNTKTSQEMMEMYNNESVTIKTIKRHIYDLFAERNITAEEFLNNNNIQWDIKSRVPHKPKKGIFVNILNTLYAMPVINTDIDYAASTQAERLNKMLDEYDIRNLILAEQLNIPPQDIVHYKDGKRTFDEILVTKAIETIIKNKKIPQEPECLKNMSPEERKNKIMSDPEVLRTFITYTKDVQSYNLATHARGNSSNKNKKVPSMLRIRKDYGISEYWLTIWLKQDTNDSINAACKTYTKEESTVIMQNIQRIMKERNLSAHRLSLMTNIHKRLFLQKNRKLSYQKTDIAKIAKALNVTVEHLLQKPEMIIEKSTQNQQKSLSFDNLYGYHTHADPTKELGNKVATSEQKTQPDLSKYLDCSHLNKAGFARMEQLLADISMIKAYTTPDTTS